VAAAPTPKVAQEVSDQPASPHNSGLGLHVFEGASSDVTSSTAKEPSRTTPRLSAVGLRMIPRALTPPRPSSGAVTLASPRQRALCRTSVTAIRTERSLGSSTV